MRIKGDPALVHDTYSEKLGKKVFLIRSDGLSHKMEPNIDYQMPTSIDQNPDT
jgi:hypothetical protein